MTLEKIEAGFKVMVLPERFELGKHAIIIDVPKFIDSHISLLRANSGNKKFMGEYYRLLNFYKEVEKMQ